MRAVVKIDFLWTDLRQGGAGSGDGGGGSGREEAGISSRCSTSCPVVAAAGRRRPRSPTLSAPWKTEVICKIPIFEKGYEKDPAVVAKEAIQEATRNKSDVVLVDSAGRMQDNEPLMRALSKLINLNKPDLVLFVGEALVGNDAVGQLNKFNQKIPAHQV